MAVTSENTRRRAQRLLPLRPADLQVLLILGDGALHAYGISKAVQRQPGGRVRLEIGSLYRTLNRMRTEGLIDESDVRDTGPQGQERRTYRITRFGRTVASAEAERLRQVVAVARDRKFLPQEGS